MLLYASASAAFLILLHTRFSERGYPKWKSLQQDVEQLHQANLETSEKIKRIENDIDALQTRTDMQEHIIRSELGYVRAQDIVLIFNTP